MTTIEVITQTITQHWGKVLAFFGGASSIAVWLRVGRSKDKLIRARNKVATSEVLMDHVDRINEKMVLVQVRYYDAMDIISYLRQKFPDTVPQAIEDRENRIKRGTTK